MPARVKAKKKPAAKALKKPTTAKPTKTAKPAKAAKNKYVMAPPKVVPLPLLDEVVAEVAGRDVVPLARLLRNKKNVSEFTLADALKREINATRNMLYRLYDNSLVTFTRKKDKKKGWYIYYWTFNDPRIFDIVVLLRKRKLEKLQERLNREKGTQFYVCYAQETDEKGKPKRGAVTMRLDFDQAMNYEFKCPESGQLLELEDNTERTKKIEQEIAELKKELATIA